MKYSVYIKNTKNGHVFIIAKGLNKEEAEKMASQYHGTYTGWIVEES